MFRLKSITLAACLITSPALAEVPGLTGGDHIGFTVPDLEQAVSFFGDVIGCDTFYQLGPFSGGGSSFMSDYLNVDRNATIPAMRLMRCGYGLNLEIFEYTAPERNMVPPRNSDVGGHHIAFYVEDMNVAVSYLREKGVKVLGYPTTTTAGPTAGQTWVFFLTPWGMQLELVSYPDGMAYEAEYEGRLWTAKNPAE